MTIQGIGYLLPTNVRVCLELQKGSSRQREARRADRSLFPRRVTPGRDAGRDHHRHGTVHGVELSGEELLNRACVNGAQSRMAIGHLRFRHFIAAHSVKISVSRKIFSIYSSGVSPEPAISASRAAAILLGVLFLRPPVLRGTWFTKHSLFLKPHLAHIGVRRFYGKSVHRGAASAQSGCSNRGPIRPSNSHTAGSICQGLAARHRHCVYGADVDADQCQLPALLHSATIKSKTAPRLQLGCSAVEKNE